MSRHGPFPPANTPKDLPRGGLKGHAARIYQKRTSVERFFGLLKRFLHLRHWGITGLARRRVLLAACAVLVMALANHALGKPLRSLCAFRRALL